MELRQEPPHPYPRLNVEDPCRWKTNIRRMQHRIKERFASQSFLRQKSQRRGVGGTPWRATGLAVARVFQDNSVMAKIARSMAKQEWQKRAGWLNAWMPKLRSALGLSAAGATLSYGSEPAQAEALVVQPPVGAIDTSSIDRQAGRKNEVDYYEEKALSVAREDSQVWRMLQAVVLPIVANSCRVFMHGLNRTEVYGAEKLHQAMLYRPNDQALITVCNHVASMDDPLVMATLLPHHMMLKASRLRWTLGATDKCFTNAAVSAFFHCVKVLPVKRGGGLQQEGLDIAVRKLRLGDWVHIFPEGGRSPDGGKTIGNLKRGIGRLLADVEKTPLVIPFVHFGMQEVMPIGSKLPGMCNKVFFSIYASTDNPRNLAFVTVLVGDPIQLEDIVKKHRQEGLSTAALHNAIALQVEQKMKELKEELDKLVLTRNLQDAAEAAENVRVLRRVQGLWQFVDWEAQGLSLEDITADENFNLSLQESDPQVVIQGLQRSSRASAQHASEVAEDLPLSLLTERDTVEPQEPDMSEIPTLQEMQGSRHDLVTIHGLLARSPGFVDPLSFLGLGFAARGFLSSATGVGKDLKDVNVWSNSAGQ